MMDGLALDELPPELGLHFISVPGLVLCAAGCGVDSPPLDVTPGRGVPIAPLTRRGAGGSNRSLHRKTQVVPPVVRLAELEGIVPAATARYRT